jgi:hypothetical protein
VKDFASRTFLNADPTRTAIVATSVEVTGKESVTGSVQISDCNRMIDLDFWAHSSAQAHEGVEKVDTLLAELKEFRRQYILRLKSAGLL